MGIFKRKPKVPYRPCGAKMSIKQSDKTITTAYCTRPKGHTGGHNNRRTS